MERFTLLSFLVTTTADSGPGSLSQAILDANAASGGTIDFDINGGGAQTIASSGLPSLDSPITIDATTQPGYSGTPLITVQGPGGSGLGLTIEPSGGGSAVRGLDITGFAAGVMLDGSAGNSIDHDVISGNQGNGLIISGTTATGNLVASNRIGTDAAGASAQANIGYGVVIFNGASGNTIGGTSAGAGNLISGNAYSGIIITDAGTSANLVEGNLIGTDATGTKPLPNENNGINVSSPGNTIGGISAGAGNVISGNGYDGLDVEGASGNLVAGNLIGTDESGASPLANGENGVSLLAAASGNTIGGTATGARNVVAGNGYDGLDIHDTGTSGNLVEGNVIGTDATGSKSLRNAGNGIEVFAGASGNTFGGTTASARNVISGNSGSGIAVRSNATANLVAGNFIGTDASGLQPLPNSGGGVVLYFAASGNTIGGTPAGAGNVIAGNNESGIVVTDSGTSNNLIAGNLIGTDATGLKALPNGSLGVDILNGASSNTIGGTSAGSGNVISGNALNGVVLSDSGTAQNVVAGNLIGTDATGTAALANGAYGVVVFNSASNNIIGGTTASGGNVISGNTYSGVTLADSGTSGNVIAGNFIGTDKTGSKALGNGSDGIDITGGVSNTTVGGTTAGAGNVIAGDQYGGVVIGDQGTTGNLVVGNLIGTDATGTVALPIEEGVNIYGGATNNTVGGTSAGSRNLISGNFDNGVVIHDAGTSGNLVEGNFIGTDSSGTKPLGDGGDGVLVVNGASSNTVGGTVAGAGNTIAYDQGNGVAVGESLSEATTGIAVLGNAIFGNAQLGIDLADDGVTPNTPGGPHTGPNALQNFPVLTAATSAGGQTTVQGTLDSAPNTPFLIELFANPAADPSGFGQGQSELGAITVTTDANGNASFTATLAVGLPAGQVITATATDPSGDTSEFSADVTVAAS